MPSTWQTLFNVCQFCVCVTHKTWIQTKPIETLHFAHDDQSMGAVLLNARWKMIMIILCGARFVRVKNQIGFQRWNPQIKIPSSCRQRQRIFSVYFVFITSTNWICCCRKKGTREKNKPRRVSWKANDCFYSKFWKNNRSHKRRMFCFSPFRLCSNRKSIVSTWNFSKCSIVLFNVSIFHSAHLYLEDRLWNNLKRINHHLPN